MMERKERDGISIKLIVLYLLKYLVKLILKSVLLFKDLKCLVLEFERHKHNPNSNTVIITEIWL